MKRSVPLAADTATHAMRSLPPSSEPLAPLRFETVYDQHLGFVWRTVRRLGVPDAAIADVVQEVFVVVHRRLNDFDGRTSLRHWLAGISLRVARREYRTRRRRQPETLGGVTAIEPDTLALGAGGDPVGRLERMELVRIVYGVLATLDPEKREVFVFAEFEQMTAPEIAKIVGIPLNTVYSRLRTARLQFEQAITGVQDAESVRRSES